MPAVAHLAALLTVAVSFSSGCEEGPKRPPPSRQRSDSVVVTSQPTAKSTADSRAPTPTAVATKKPRKVCGAPPVGLDTPKGTIAVAAASGAGELPNPIPFGAGKWIWVNLWAAWCKPCIAEMPRLREFHAELRQQGVLLDLAFVSLDDDERQLRRFLDAEKRDGLRVSYWLKEQAREEWLQPFKVSAEAELPVHIFVDPKGTVRCIINGAVESTDFPQLRKLFQGGG